MGRIRLNEPPTEKQVRFAQEIADVLELELPRLKTKITYSEFISEHIGEWRAINEEMDWGSEWNWGLYCND